MITRAEIEKLIEPKYKAIPIMGDYLTPMQEALTTLLSALDKAGEALDKVKSAYCGIGDFEGTGENMAEVIVVVNDALAEMKPLMKE